MIIQFWENVTNYVKLADFQDSILEPYIEAFKDLNWKTFSKLRKGSLPYPYLVRKQKDTGRVRTVVSFHCHSLRDTYFISAVGSDDLLGSPPK